jgi:hypothetical protein
MGLKFVLLPDPKLKSKYWVNWAPGRMYLHMKIDFEQAIKILHVP